MLHQRRLWFLLVSQEQPAAVGAAGEPAEGPGLEQLEGTDGERPQREVEGGLGPGGPGPGVVVASVLQVGDGEGVDVRLLQHPEVSRRGGSVVEARSEHGVKGGPVRFPV